jgi:hypothetical protein
MEHHRPGGLGNDACAICGEPVGDHYWVYEYDPWRKVHEECRLRTLPFERELVALRDTLKQLRWLEREIIAAGKLVDETRKAWPDDHVARRTRTSDIVARVRGLIRDFFNTKRWPPL